MKNLRKGKKRKGKERKGNGKNRRHSLRQLLLPALLQHPGEVLEAGVFKISQA
jgi:hypothetical protein